MPTFFHFFLAILLHSPRGVHLNLHLSFENSFCFQMCLILLWLRLGAFSFPIQWTKCSLRRSWCVRMCADARDMKIIYWSFRLLWEWVFKTLSAIIKMKRSLWSRNSFVVISFMPMYQIGNTRAQCTLKEAARKSERLHSLCQSVDIKCIGCLKRMPFWLQAASDMEL